MNKNLSKSSTNAHPANTGTMSVEDNYQASDGASLGEAVSSLMLSSDTPTRESH
jgi:hypothetical protein